MPELIIMQILTRNAKTFFYDGMRSILMKEQVFVIFEIA